jgi:cytochrome c5
MKTLKGIFFGVLLLAAMPVISQTGNTNAAPANGAQQQAKSSPAPAVHQRDGEQVFAQNCSRCHTAPQGFSSRISGTITRHMRVRAGLSKEDEQALLRFLNP